MTFDPDRACPHEDFAADVDVNRLGDGDHGQPDTIIGYSADIRIRCADCGEPFRWIGVPAGMNSRRPACSPDETELRAPIRPASADPDFGMGIPGFAIRMVGPPEYHYCECDFDASSTGGLCDTCGLPEPPPRNWSQENP